MKFLLAIGAMFYGLNIHAETRDSGTVKICFIVPIRLTDEQPLRVAPAIQLERGLRAYSLMKEVSPRDCVQKFLTAEQVEYLAESLQTYTPCKTSTYEANGHVGIRIKDCNLSELQQVGDPELFDGAQRLILFSP